MVLKVFTEFGWCEGFGIAFFTWELDTCVFSVVLLRGLLTRHLLCLACAWAYGE